MNTVTVNEATLIVEPMGLDKLWSFERRLEIPVYPVGAALPVIRHSDESKFTVDPISPDIMHIIGTRV
jgi:hypothetical protein